MPVEITGIKQETTFTVEISESAVRALAMLGEFGAGALENLVASKLSDGEAKRHSKGLAEIQMIGTEAKPQLDRLADARAVAAGEKFAVKR